MEDSTYSIIVSQIGYRPEEKKIGIIRSDSLNDDIFSNQEINIVCVEDQSTVCVTKNISYWGEKWGIHFWIIDFSEIKIEGEFYLQFDLISLKSSSFIIKNFLLLEKTLIKTSVGQLDLKVGGKLGWQDCGSDLRAVEGHVAQLLGLIDCFESLPNLMSDEQKSKFREHIDRGADYIALCQREDGSFVNEYYSVQDKKSWTLSMMATIALAGAYEVTDVVGYLDSAKRGWNYCTEIIHYTRTELLEEIEETRKVFGKYSPWVPPMGLRSRDKMLIVWAGTELYKNTNDVKYKSVAIKYADELCEKLQFLDYTSYENGVYGNFYAWENSGIHQKSWEHIGWGYNCGAIFPDEINGLINLLDMFPEQENWHRWRYSVKQYAYGYLKATSTHTPFRIYPLGLFDGEVRFFGPSWHGFNGIYGRVARTSMMIAHLFEDLEFEIIADQNMQWVVGLNTGIKNDSGAYEGVSCINGIGKKYARAWTNIEGSICNGFCANPQFKLEHLDDLEDRPAYLTTEDWIVHNGGWLSGLSQIEKPFIMKIKTQYKGNPVQAEIKICLPEEYSYKTNSRGLQNISTLPVLRKGTVIITWNDSYLEYELTTISGLKKVLVSDFSDSLKACLSIDKENKKCILMVTNRGKDQTNIHLYLRAVGIRLSTDEMEEILKSAESKEFVFQYEPINDDSIKPFYIYSEIAGNYSSVVCEIDWKE